MGFILYSISSRSIGLSHNEHVCPVPNPRQNRVGVSWGNCPIPMRSRAMGRSSLSSLLSRKSVVPMTSSRSIKTVERHDGLAWGSLRAWTASECWRGNPLPPAHFTVRAICSLSKPERQRPFGTPGSPGLKLSAGLAHVARERLKDLHRAALSAVPAAKPWESLGAEGHVISTVVVSFATTVIAVMTGLNFTVGSAWAGLSSMA